MARNIRGAAVHTEVVGFRVAETLLTALSEKAAARGMGFSEYLRDLVRRDVLGEP